MKPRAAVILALLLTAGQATGGQAPQQTAGVEGIARLLTRLETIIAAGRPADYLDLVAADASRDRAAEAAQTLTGQGVTRAVVRERDRVGLGGSGSGEAFRLMLEIFTERGVRARVTTWQFDVVRAPGGAASDQWRVTSQQLLTTVDGLFRLSLNPARQYRARNLVVRSDDAEISVAEGHVFVAETNDAPTAVVLIPTGGSAFEFKPGPETERGQVRIYCGSDSVHDQFSAAFIRVNPADFAARFPSGALTPEPVDPDLFRRADAVFREDLGKSFGIDLADLSRDAWSLAPAPGDLLAEVHTRRFRTLTYAKVGNEAEDITLFDRQQHRYIAIYPSPRHVAAQGRFFDEDALQPYAVERTDLDVKIDPDRFWLTGVARLRVRVKDATVNNLVIRLAEPLTVGSIYSSECGRLFSLRVHNLSSIMVSLPAHVMKNTTLTLVVNYSGRLVPPPPDREGFGPQFPPDAASSQDQPQFVGEPSVLYSTNSAWYPQGPVTSYGTASMRITVPDRYQVLASGELQPGFPAAAPAFNGRFPAWLYAFEATQPVRYLACSVSRFVRVAATTVTMSGLGGARTSATLKLSVETNPRAEARGREIAKIAEDLVRYYATLLGDLPYPSLTVGVVEHETPGGHSPAYLSLLNEPLPASQFNWAGDPAAFPNYPEFFIAHELAHQWWGQGVGWRSYHERWSSEGFAQYMAALYARQLHGEERFKDLIRRMARWGVDQADQGPISLGYRLGHIRGDSRVFRALVYNKSAVVLDMLRRRLGDEAFFRGLRRFYRDWRFRKAGTDDVRAAFEAESGESLEPFFEGWVHRAGVPRLVVSWRLDAASTDPAAIVRLEQVGPLYDYPVTLTLRYAGGATADMRVLVREQASEVRVPLTGALRGLDINRDGLTMVDASIR